MNFAGLPEGSVVHQREQAEKGTCDGVASADGEKGGQEVLSKKEQLALRKRIDSTGTPQGWLAVEGP